MIWGLGLLALFLGGGTLARFLYYGELLPNTYYLKIEGWPFSLRVLRGLYALAHFMYYSNWVLILLPLCLLLRRDRRINLLLAVIAGQLAYSVYVGGDAWEDHGGANRYIAIAMPLFFAVFALALEDIRSAAVRALTTKEHKGATTKALRHKGTKRKTLQSSRLGALVLTDRYVEPVSRLLLFSLLICSLLNFNALAGDWKSIERWTFQRRPDFTAGNEHNLQIALALQEVTLPPARRSR